MGGDKDKDKDKGDKKGKNKDGEESSEEEETGDQTDGSKKGKRKKKKKKEGGGHYSADVDAAHERINTETLSKKEELFQIRFIVHKARKLVGAIQLPLVRIHLDTKVLRTKPKKGKNPRWNETVLFSITKSELDLINTPVEIRVIDTAKSTQYSLIGLYTCDLAVAWVAKGKNLFYKWFALTNPDEPQDGMMGYVNISIQIIPPGESAKDLPRVRDEEIDISDNVFFPPGITLQPGQFVIKLLNGEDVPQMDTAMFEGLKKILRGGEEDAKPKELVDPYTKIEFAGTVLESSVRECTFDPIWNEQLIIRGQFPSMAENIVLKLYDNDDFAVDDLIATKLLRMTEISHSSAEAGQGFSPTFGPAYIPFYGSTREFSDVYDKYSDLNHGVDKGIAYRGRILIEITTNMGEPPEDQEAISPLAQAETDRIMMNLCRHKYHLFASFFQGNMISEKENQVEFEVSIGDYGNKFSPHASPAPSTTQPCNAVYDGTEYHFMPWGRTKPTVILHSEWEDVEYRVETLNTLIWMRDFLEEKMEQYNVLVNAHAKDYELEVKFEKNLQEILNVLKETPLNEPDDHESTELDNKQFELRKFTINNLIDEVSAMLKGRLQYMSRQEKVKRLQAVYEKLEELCVEPQLGIPDVFIWMLTGTKRVAYVRIPINEIMWSKSKFARGKHCGVTGSFFLKLPKEDTIGSHLTLSLWFGKFEHVTETFKPPRGSDVIVYAETYENQMSVLGSWTTKLLPRPIFSDGTGKYNLPLASFEPPEGWSFTDDWFISIDRSLTFDNESGLKEVTDVVYEGETRIPGTQWTGPFVSLWWQDIKGDESPPKDQLECPEGWHYAGDWETDCNRAVDAQGWEYAMDTNIANYSPIERGYHLSRRKKWHRLRERISDINLIKKKDIDPDGWEYSKIFTTKFHPKERKFDMVRRRRYNRRLASSIPRPVVFRITEEEKGDKPAKIFNMAPRIITEYDERQVHKYQLRAYLYQARGVLGADPTGYSDPYARVVFGNRSAVTQTIRETVSPVWDTTLVLDAVELCGYPDDIACNPPYIVIDLFDEDVLTHDKLGRVVCRPVVYSSGRYSCTKLTWYPIGGVKKSKGDLLAAFELFKLGDGGIELPLLPPFEGMRYLVPAEIRPPKQLMRVEILTWGVRLMKDYKMIPVDSPHIDIDVGGESISIDKIASLKKHPNFATPYTYFDVWLPVDEEYLPPINIRVMDNRAFGYTPLVAVATIKEYGQYRTVYHLGDPSANVRTDDANILKEIMAEEAADNSLAGIEPEPFRAPSEAGVGTVLDLETGGSISLNIAVEVEEPRDHIAVQIEEPNKLSSDSTAQLIPSETRSEQGTDQEVDGSVIITNPTASLQISEGFTDISDVTKKETDSVTDITITIPQGVIDASQSGTPVDTKIEKQLEKDLKRQERQAKKDAKLRKKQQRLEKRDKERQTQQIEKEREKVAKEQAKAKYKAEQARKKKELKKAAEDDSEEEEFVPEDPPESPVHLQPPEKALSGVMLNGDEVSDKAAGLLGMWYGSNNTDPDAPTEPKSSISKLSRKETRKLKQEDEKQPHPDDILVSDWWSKYYHARGGDERLERIFKQRNLPTIKMYDEELEKSYGMFRDLMEVVRLQRQDTELSSDFEVDSEDEDNHVGLFKGSFKIYPITEEMQKKDPPVLMFYNLPSNAPSDVIVRLYVVAGINLTPLDFGGSVDPYLYVKCGREVRDDKSNYITKAINPEFGKLFEFNCSLPRDSQMSVTVYDYDMIGSNDVVGTTTIDLEDRFLSWKHAACGVSQQYIIDKENKDFWRDTIKPIGLLKRVCVLRGWPQPSFKGRGSTIRCYVNGAEYKMKYFESGRMKKAEDNKTHGSDEHRLALYVLHELGVVPEHFETRTLYNEDCPGIPQGKLHLWVDIFPYDRNPPPPYNITPRVTDKMVLRVIVWNTQDVILSDENLMGERMSDIFVKINIEGMTNKSQETDVHFRSLTGEGNFNWRMTYDFEYLMAEQKVVVYQRKSLFSIDKEMMKVDPILHIKVFDYDIFSSDDLLGWTELSLVSLPPPKKTHKECNLDIYDTPVSERISIIDKKKIKGFWPVYDDSMGESEMTGKVELEIEILTQEEAEERPAGQGRSDPNENPTLEPPNRPETSFNWFLNPLMVFKILIWDKYKWYIIGAFLILLLIAFIGLLIYTSPGAMTAALFG